ncbi:MAG: hypothetical protein M3239_02910, partial [Thermoproteota archaeon]|nr:hypothetical protein [Thermoproteota archaeon]
LTRMLLMLMDPLYLLEFIHAAGQTYLSPDRGAAGEDIPYGKPPSNFFLYAGYVFHCFFFRYAGISILHIGVYRL